MTYLVSGGAGFIGSHLLERMLQEGERAVVVDDFSVGQWGNIPRKRRDLVVYTKDIRDDLSEIFKKERIDCVFHLAAIPRVQYSIGNPRETNEVHIGGTLNLLETCRIFKVKRFIFSSSAAVYGEQARLPEKEDAKPNPLSPYALQKLTGEYYCRLYHILYGLETIVFRYFNVYGPRQSAAGGYANLIPTFFKLLSFGIAPTINGDGENKRDYIFVSDVIEANMRAARTRDKRCFSQVMNIGSGQAFSVNEVAEKIVKMVNSKIRPMHGPVMVEPKATLADITKAKKLLGWEPAVSFEEGLKETYRKLKTL